MVTFKKDKDKKKNIINEIKTSFILFLSGFIIASFLIIYILLAFVNKMNNDRNNIEPSIDPGSGEVIDIYKNEKEIINNLTSILKEYNEELDEIRGLTFDSDSIYISSIGKDDIFYILSIDLDSNNIDEILESLITSKEGIEVASTISMYDISNLPNIDVSNTDAFKSDIRYKDYSYHLKNNYYINDLHDKVGLSCLGYKNNTYIVLTSLIYDINNEELIENYKVTTSDPSSEYYKVIDYLYNK